MWGIVPAAGRGSRIQPLVFSKELLPLGGALVDGQERPRAVSELLVERMTLAGCRKICFVISPGKADILQYFGPGVAEADACYVVQAEPRGLCDAIFRALPLVGDGEFALVGLPDTIWFPETALRELDDAPLSFLLFPVDAPQLFDAVVSTEDGRVVEIEVKQPAPRSHWIWGAFKASGAALRDLQRMWCERDRADVYVGTLVNAYLARGGTARAVRAGRSYVDVGTLTGYREALRLLRGPK